MDRYIVRQVVGLQLWYVVDTETEQQVGEVRTDEIVAIVEAGDLNFSLKFDTDPEFRAAYYASIGVKFDA